jgi:uncharacterized protein (TIGR03437 family)
MAGMTQATMTVTADLAVVAPGTLIPADTNDKAVTITSPPVTVNLSAFAPGIFSINSQETGQGAVLISNTAVFAAPTGSISGSSARPANRGEFITIYCTCLGGVYNSPASGAPAGSSPTSNTTAAPTVTIGGVQATPAYSGLSPGFAGIYQIDVPVPNSSPREMQLLSQSRSGIRLRIP